MEPSEPYDASIPAGSNDGTYDQFRYREASTGQFSSGHEDMQVK